MEKQQYQTLEQAPDWFEIKEEIYELSGKDHVNFLNAYNTQNIQTIPLNSITPGAFLTQKGKLVSSAQLIRLPDKIILLFEPGFGRKVLDHLQIYLTFAQATLQEVTSQWVHWGILGTNAKHLIEKIFGTDFLFFPTDRFGITGYDLLAPIAKKHLVLEKIKNLEIENEIVPLESSQLETLRIEAKIPKMGVDITEDNLVAEVGLDQTATSFNKGCYLGQETTARVQSRGHVNRKIFQFGLTQSYQGNLPVDIFQAEKKVGTLTSAVESMKLGGYIGLGLLHLQALEHEEPLFINAPDGKIILNRR